jgi:hypothetical protein
MTDIATKIVEAIFDQATLDGGLLKDKAIARVREVVGSEPSRLYTVSDMIDVSPAPHSDAYELYMECKAQSEVCVDWSCVNQHDLENSNPSEG